MLFIGCAKGREVILCDIIPGERIECEGAESYILVNSTFRQVNISWSGELFGVHSNLYNCQFSHNSIANQIQYSSLFQQLVFF